MKATRQFALVLLLLVSYLTPAMACMVSDVQMNAEERACYGSLDSGGTYHVTILAQKNGQVIATK